MIGVGKINDIFCGEGITETYHSTSQSTEWNRPSKSVRRIFMACALSIWLTLMHSGATEEIQKVMAMRLKNSTKISGVLLEQLKKR